MTEYWKNSPNYWCKHCAVYVRDTKLERQNHEATGKHQYAIKRSLRDLHRTHDREERDKERARREIDRLNGVVAASPADDSRFKKTSSSQQGTGTDSALKQQREQLAQMGVSIPSAFLPEMAMPGEWTVTSSRVIEDGDAKETSERLATGVRKRGETEEDKEEQDAVRGLFKKPKRWGRDTKALPEGEDAALDALLSGSVKLKGEQGDRQAEVKEEEEEEQGSAVKNEPDNTEELLVQSEGGKEEKSEVKVKAEEDDGEDKPGIAPVVFKKRKPKGLRIK